MACFWGHPADAGPESTPPLLSSIPAKKEAPTWLGSAGARIGLGSNQGAKLTSFELFGTSPTWKSWQPNSTTSLSLSLEGSLGLLGKDDDLGFLARLGPLLDVTFDDSPIHLMLGTSAAFVADQKFGRLDLGSHYQFISSVGFDWHFAGDWVFGYRWQHISNGGLTETNPGLNLNTLSLAYRF